MFLAHITRAAGLRTEQTLKEHSRRTAEYAAQSVAGTGLEDAAYLAGLLHDMGKAKREYQTYLEDAFAGRKVAVGSVNHTFAGVDVPRSVGDYDITLDELPGLKPEIIDGI
jgi:CRISPR-associated endonuclease/helicase Cas3